MINIGIRELDRLTIADGIGRVLADTYTQRLQVHEKTAWMLRSMLDQPIDSSAV